MRVIAGTPPQTSFTSRTLVAGIFVFLALTALSPVPLALVAPAAAAAMVVAAFHRPLLAWPTMLTVLLLVILLIPMRRYTLPISVGGFELEPYRLIVAAIVGAWAISLLIDRRVRLRPTGLEAPFGLILLSILWSVAWNANEIVKFGVKTDVIKAFVFFSMFFLLFYLITTTVRPQQVWWLAKVLVVCGAVVGFFAVIEGQTGFNVFDKLGNWVPFLHHNFMPGSDLPTGDAGFNRGDRLRTYASAEHPIALAAALAMILPIGVALAITRSNRWWIAVLPIGMATLSTLSRTGVLMLMVIGIVFLWLRPRRTLRMWWAIVPLVVACNVVMPHTLGILKASFFPTGGLIAEQQSSAGSTTAGGRATDFGPVLARVRERPLFGVGFATTVLPIPGQPAQQRVGPATPPVTRILDNQWLGTLLETGYVGMFAWLWLFCRFCRRLGRASRGDDSDEGWLIVAIVAAVAASAVGMFTYDAFAFTQATFITFVLMAFGVVLGGERMLGGRRARAAARQAPQPA